MWRSQYHDDTNIQIEDGALCDTPME